MDLSSLKDSLLECVGQCAEMLNFNIEETIHASKRSINIWSYDAENALMEAYQLLHSGEVLLSVEKVKEARSFVARHVNVEESSFTSDEAFDTMIEKLSTIRNFYQIDIDKTINQVQSYISEYLLSSSLFDSDENMTNFIDLSQLNEIYKSFLNKRLINIKITSGTNFVLKGKKMRWAKDMLVTYDLSKFIQQIPESSSEDIVTIYPIFCLHPQIIDYSYFVIALSYSESVIMLTDVLSFENPRVENSSRNPQRRRSSHYDSIDFPYYLMNDGELDKYSNFPVTNDMSAIDVNYTIPMKDIYGAHRAFMVILVWMYESYQDLTTPVRANTLGNLFSKLLLPSNVVDDNESLYRSNNTEAINEQMDEIIVPDSESKALVVVSNDLVLKHPDYKPSVFLDESEYSRYIEWFKREEIRDNSQRRLNKQFYGKESGIMRMDGMDTHLRDEVKQWYYDKMKENYSNVEHILFSGQQVFYQDSEYTDDEDISFNRNPKKEISYTLIIDGHNKVRDEVVMWAEKMNPQTHQWKSEYDCIATGKKATKFIVFRARHYKHLMLLFGCKREELHPVMQNYKAHNFEVYTGNSILSDVDPVALVYEPFSHRYANGLNLAIGLSAVYYNQMLRKYKKAELVGVTEELAIEELPKDVKRSIGGYCIRL